MRWLALLAAAAAWPACDSTSDAVLDLRDDNGDCAAAFGGVRTLSIEAFADNGACRLNHACVFDVEASSVEELEQAIRDSADVVLALDPDSAQTLKINGRPLEDCFPVAGNEPVLCGNVNLREAGDGVLELELECSGCTESGPLCE